MFHRSIMMFGLFTIVILSMHARPAMAHHNDISDALASIETKTPQIRSEFDGPPPSASPTDNPQAERSHLFDHIPTDKNWLGLPKAEGPFKQWSWQISAIGTFDNNTFRRGADEYIYGGALSVGFYVYDNVSFNFEFQGVYFDVNEGENAAGFGLTLMARWHFLNFSELETGLDWLNGITVYMEIGAGIMMTEHRVPTSAGTHFNFTPQGGFGLTWEFTPGLHLYGGLRMFHQSNARIRGADRNPTWDGLKAYAGVMWTF